MKLYNITKDKLNLVETKQFPLERDIQNLIEKNTLELFNVEFVESELTVGKYRIDTLCYDEENNSFVIVEYKKGDSYSVIDQGYTYLQLLLNNKSDFLLTLSKHFNRVLDVKDIDWSQSKIVFISQSFNKFQKDSVNFKNLPFELWEIKRYSNSTLVLNQHKPTSDEKIDSLNVGKNDSLINSVNKEVKVVEIEEHLSKSKKEIIQVWNELSSRFSELEGVELVSKKHYVSLSLENKTVGYFNFQKNGIRLDFSRGNVNPDGTRSKNYFDIDDPKGISKESSWEWKSGTKGTVYKISILKDTDIDYIMFLIKQKYKNIINP
jgi:hypothetical protein